MLKANAIAFINLYGMSFLIFLPAIFLTVMYVKVLIIKFFEGSNIIYLYLKFILISIYVIW